MNKVVNYGLGKSNIDAIVSVFSKNIKISSAILFGSRAKGNFSQGSDVDIALKGNGLNLDDLLNASLEIDDLLLPYKFDLIIFERIKEQTLIEHINRVGIKLYEREIKT
ncbi:MAG: nucleotidyltransferase domain-containing protein [Bacteroidetes bacterium]|nr:MAG: nucleotidyltransferase domain-containing protein [Bacteroidota bacterium]